MRVTACPLVLFLAVILPVAVYSQSYATGSQNDPEQRVYQFLIGEKLAAALQESCSSAIGSINSIEDEKIGLVIEERLSGPESDEQTIQLNYREPRPDFAFNSESSSPWDRVIVEQGKWLFVSRCQRDPAHLGYKIVVSDDRYFPAIREIILFDERLRNDPNVLLEIPRLLSSQDNLVLAGYITLRLRGGSAGNRENAAIVLSEILGSRNFPPVGLAFARISLWQLLVREGEDSLQAATRNRVIEHLVDLASSPNGGTGIDQIFFLFLQLAEKDKIDIGPFLDRNNRKSFISNYRNVNLKDVSVEGRRKFEAQLFASDDNSAQLSKTPSSGLHSINPANDYLLAEKALAQAILERDSPALRMGLKSPFSEIKIKAAEAIASMNDRPSVPALVDALALNQGVLDGGTETQIQQNELNKTLVSAIEHLTHLKFKVAKRLSSEDLKEYRPFSTKEIQDVVDKTSKWFESSQRSK